jgi:hypothetical protein
MKKVLLFLVACCMAMGTMAQIQDAHQTITITGPFTVALGSELEAKTDY